MTRFNGHDIVSSSNPPKADFRYRNNMSKAILAVKAYFRDSISEMKKVVWPTKKQTRAYTITVILLSIGVAIFFGLLDYVFNLGLGAIIR